MKKWSELSNSEQVALLEEYKKSTGPKACEKFGVDYQSAHNILAYHVKKGLGHGGKRAGSGNKKGVEFCGKCRQKKKNCKC